MSLFDFSPQFVYDFNVDMRFCVASANNVSEQNVTGDMVTDLGLELGNETSMVCRETKLVCHFPQVFTEMILHFSFPFTGFK